jgi:hypothetical protein
MIQSWTKGVLWLTVAVSAGFAGGVAFERQRVSRRSTSPMDPANVMRVLDQSLQLDSAQHVAIGAVFARRQIAIDSAWVALQPQMKAAVDSTQAEIVRLLRPAQATQFLELMRTTHAGRQGMNGEQRRP